MIGLVLVAALGGGLWFLSPYLPAWARLSSSTAKPAVKAEPPVTHTILVANLVVNLGRAGGEALSEDRRRARPHDRPSMRRKSRSTSRRSRSDHRMLAVTPVEALADEKGRAELKRELVEKIHEELKLEAVRRVYFTEFVIQ